jgi:hypothetical protein
MSRFPQVFPQKQGGGRVKESDRTPDKFPMAKRNPVRVKFEVVFSATLMSFSASLFLVTNVSAQSGIDPSSALLLNSGNRSQDRATTERAANEARDARLESGRYTVRPRDRAGERPIERQPTPTPSPKRQGGPSVPLVNSDSVQTSTTSVVVSGNEQGAVVIPNVDQQSETSEPVIVHSRGGNLLEIAVGTAYLYENSSSSYSYRKYSLAAPAYSIDARVWLGPEFGVGGSYLSSLGATVADGGNDSAVARADTSFGVFVRKAIGQEAKEKYLTLGLEFVDFQFRAPADSTNRVKTKTTGARLSVRGDWADFRLGFSIAPKLQHEESAPATGVRSGATVESYRVGFMVERRWLFDSSNSIFLRLQHDVEQNAFSGPASSPDQVSGSTPNGVGVTHGTTVIQFGYDWGQ